MLDIESLCRELEGERDRIQAAINSLRAIPGEPSASTNGNHRTLAVVKRAAVKPDVKPKALRTMSRAARKRISDAQKARWAAQKAPPPKRRTMSAAARKRMSEGMKARWAARKSQAS